MSRSFIVNAITFARVPLIFGWFVCAVVEELRGGWGLAVAACVMLALSGLTDLWDGMLARKWNCVSALGKMADPLMDKVFYVFTFPTLAWLAVRSGGSDVHSIAVLVLTVLYMLRDSWVTFMRSVGTMFGADVAAMWLGKVRTALSFPGAGWLYAYFAFNPFLPDSFRAPWLWSCYLVEAALGVLTVWSFYTYTVAYLPYLKRALANRP